MGNDFLSDLKDAQRQLRLKMTTDKKTWGKKPECST